VLDSAGNRVSTHAYTPYGQAIGDDFSLQPFGMSTKRSDFSSGLVYFGYRFYMPNLGRWLNRDPLQEAGGINLYAYVNGDPMGYVDPDGRFAMLLLPPLILVSDGLVGAIVGTGLGVGICAATGICNFSEEAEDESDNESNPCPPDGSPSDKKLSKGEIDKLKDAGYDPHDLKPKKKGSRFDLFKDKNGNIIIKPKNGNGPGDSTGLNINNF
jgi:RHS repeat-associated protein